MKHCFLALLFATIGIALCACSGQQTNGPGSGSGSNGGGPRSDTGTGEADDRRLLGADATNRRFGPKVSEYDVTQEQFDQEQVARFLRTRCLTLGRALTQLASSEKEIRELAEQDVMSLLERDNATIAAAARARGRPVTPNEVSGLIVPRFIANALREPRKDWDVKWLALQGTLLQLAYEFEGMDLNTWKLAIGQYMKLGKEGREALAVQMVIRLRLANVIFRDYAADVLVKMVPDEAVEPLVIATHVDMHDMPGVFPRLTSSVLAQIGKKAVPTIHGIFKSADGKHSPANDGNWKVRRYLIDALGEIGDAESVDLLVTELETCSFKVPVRRDLYGSVIVQALGRIRDKRAVPAIVKEWRRYELPSDFLTTARPALFLILGRVYSTPNEVTAGAGD
jgi:HEAT repeat protein